MTIAYDLFVPKNLLTVTQVAEKLGISTRRVNALINAGRLPAEKFGQSWMIKSSDVAKVRVRKPGRPSTKPKR